MLALRSSHCAEIDSQRSEVVQVLEAPEPKARMRWCDRSQSNNRQTIGKIREASQAHLCIISSKNSNKYENDNSYCGALHCCCDRSARVRD